MSVNNISIITNIVSWHTIGKRNYILGCNVLNCLVIKLSICSSQAGVKICAAIGIQAIYCRFNSIVSGYC